MRKIALFSCSIFLFCIQMFAQNRIINGKVLDEKGNPLPLVSVSVKGVPNGVTTAEDGSFELSINANTRKLIISSIGYLGQEINLGASNHITVVLKLNSGDEIGEVIVTGYSRLKRSEYAGAATIVGKESIGDIPMAGLDQILQGRVPGLLVTTNSGQPGEEGDTKVQIRGQSSIDASSDPLYVVDGMPVEAENFRSLNPADFENIQVLRDAIATAQYGNRGSSGVIVITTKKGRVGKSIFSYSGQTGITQPGKQYFDMANSAQILQIQEDIGLQVPSIDLPGWVYSSKNPAYASLTPVMKAQYDQTLDSLRHINTDWKDIFEHQGHFTRHDLNLSGGSENTRFYIAGGYYKEDGIGLNSGLTRYTFRTNLDHKAKNLTLSLSSGFGYSHSDMINSENARARANTFAAIYLALPYQKLYNPDGSIATGSGNTGANAYDLQVNGSAIKEGQLKADISLRATYDITKNIYLGSSIGIDYRQINSTNTIYPDTYFANVTSLFPIGPRNPPTDTIGQGDYGTNVDNYFEYVVRALAGFRKVFEGKHDVDLQLVSEYTKDHQDGFGYTGYGIDPNLLNTPAGITQGTIANGLIAATSGYRQERSLYAAMALARYTYLDRYTLNASFRRDATSQLAPDKRFQNFYAAGVTWDILKESFARTWTMANILHLRLSYGESANSDQFISGYYGYLPGYSASSYAGQPSVIPTSPGNQELTWPRIKTWNAGIDFGFFKDRVSGSLDIYHKLTDKDILFENLSYTSGFSAQFINAGSVVNKGIELALNVELLRIGALKWVIGGNISYNHNEVTSLGQSLPFEQGTSLVKVGLPLGSYNEVKWAGVDASTGQPLYYDKNGKVTNSYSFDNAITGLGSYNAPWIGGFSTGLSYKGLSLEAFFTFQQGFTIFNDQDNIIANSFYAGEGYNSRTSMLSMWQKPGDVSDIQSAATARNFSSKDVQDASYLRFRNLTLAYSINRKLLEKARVFSAARIFVQAQNLYTWTRWTGLDPEYASNIATFSYPVPRTYTFGLSFSFN